MRDVRVVPIHDFIEGIGKFPIQKCAIFCKFKEIGGIARRRTVLYATQAIPLIDAEIAEKGHLWTETRATVRNNFKRLRRIEDRKRSKSLRRRLSMSKRDEFIRKMKDRLDEWNQEIDVFEEKIRKIKTDMTDKYQAQIDELRNKRREGDRKLEQIRTAGEDTWAHLKAESEHAWNAMKDALEAFKAHYRKDDDSSKGSADHAK